MSILSKMVSNELKIILPYSLIFDLVIFIATLFVYGINYEVPLGLLLGTFAMLVNMVLLGHASQHSVERPLKQAKRYMFSFYLIRMCILGVAIVAGFHFDFFNAIAVCIPLFYPRVIYTLRAIRKKY